MMKRLIDVTCLVSMGADKVMHAALHLVGKEVVSEVSYVEPAVWFSDDPAVVLLRERYEFLLRLLEYLYMVNNL